MGPTTTRLASAFIVAGVSIGGLTGGFALAAGEGEPAMHHTKPGTAMHHSSKAGDPEMPEEGAAMSHGAAMHEASVTG